MLDFFTTIEGIIATALAVPVLGFLIGSITRGVVTSGIKKANIEKTLSDFKSTLTEDVVNKLVGGDVNIDFTAIAENKLQELILSIDTKFDSRMTAIDTLRDLLEAVAEIYTNQGVKSATAEQKGRLTALLKGIKEPSRPKNTITITAKKEPTLTPLIPPSEKRENKFPKIGG